MTRPLRILTLAAPRAWLDAAASVGHRWDAVESEAGGVGDWWARVRALPRNIRPVRAGQAAVAVSRGAYDAVICHDPAQRVWVGLTSTPIISVFHVPEPLAALFGDGRADLDRRVAALPKEAARVFTSGQVRRSWGGEGEVIPPGIATDDTPWDGRIARALIAGDFLDLLAPINGSTCLESAAESLPIALRGLNPGTEEHRPARAELRETMRTHRLFLHASLPPFQEGYSTTMLEAMAAGMPVVSFAHPESPIEDGMNGLVAADPQALRAEAERLLADHGLAIRLGAAARETVRARFPLETFQARWRSLLEDVTSPQRTRVA